MFRQGIVLFLSVSRVDAFVRHRPPLQTSSLLRSKKTAGPLFSTAGFPEDNGIGPGQILREFADTAASPQLSNEEKAPKVFTPANPEATDVVSDASMEVAAKAGALLLGTGLALTVATSALKAAAGAVGAVAAATAGAVQVPVLYIPSAASLEHSCFFPLSLGFFWVLSCPPARPPARRRRRRSAGRTGTRGRQRGEFYGGRRENVRRRRVGGHQGGGSGDRPGHQDGC